MLQLAVDEADRLLHNYIGTEHLLLGILREERSVAATILIEKGMRLESVRKDVEELSSAHDLEHRISGFHGHDFPQYLPSDTVHISLSRRESQDISEGPRHWILLGFDLATAMAQACGIDRLQLILPGQLEDGVRYDLALVMRSDTSTETMRQIVSRALEKQFEVTMSREVREGGEVVVVRPTQL